MHWNTRENIQKTQQKLYNYQTWKLTFHQTVFCTYISYLLMPHTFWTIQWFGAWRLVATVRLCTCCLHGAIGLPDLHETRACQESILASPSSLFFSNLNDLLLYIKIYCFIPSSISSSPFNMDVIIHIHILGLLPSGFVLSGTVVCTVYSRAESGGLTVFSVTVTFLPLTILQESSKQLGMKTREVLPLQHEPQHTIYTTPETTNQVLFVHGNETRLN